VILHHILTRGYGFVLTVMEILIILHIMKRRKKLHSPKPQHSRNSTFISALGSMAQNRYLPLLVLIALSSFIAIMRLHTYNEPFERDITSHSVIAHEILAGRQLYSDLWDSKPPAIFITYAAADALVGYGPAEVYFIGVLAAVVTLLGLYRAGSACGNKAGGLWAAAFWTFICSDLLLWANQPNIEVCINACMVWAFALMLGADGKKLQPARWLVIGGLFALATLYKPVAITFAAFLGVLYILAPAHKGRSRKLAFFQICITAAVGAAAWAAVFAYFALTDRFSVFYETVFKYAGYYAASRGGGLVKNILEGFHYKRLFAPAMKSTTVLAVLAAAGAVLGLWKGPRRNWLLLLGFAVAAQIAIALPGRFYRHYYQLLLGPLVIGAAWAVSVFVKKGPKPGPMLISCTAGAVGLIILMCTTLPQYKLSADEWSAKKITPQFVISRKVVAEVDKMLKPGETLYVWGQNPEFYFWSKRKPPTGLIWSTDLMDNPLAEKHTARALAELKQHPPEIFVINILQFKVPRNHPVIAWAFQQYIPLPGNPQRGVLFNRPFFYIMIRRGGELAARLGL